MFKTYEEFKIKDQTSSVNQAKKLLTGAIQQPNLVASKFKCIRGLDTDHLKALLQKLADGEMSFAEMKLRAIEIKNMSALKTEFVKKAGCESWEEALERQAVDNKYRTIPKKLILSHTVLLPVSKF